MGEDIAKAIKILTNGGIVAIPTETVYGLAANIFDDCAVKKIFKVKSRPFFDPLIVHIGTIEQLATVGVNISGTLDRLVKIFWPGPLTILVKKKKNISQLITANSDFVAVRMPRHCITIELLKSVNFPLAAPSANPFGYVSPTSAKHVEDQLGNKIDYIIDGGICSVGLESTIISENEKGEVIIHRLGGVSVEELKFSVDKNVPIKIAKNNNEIVTAGLCSSHYAPKKKLIVGEIEGLIHKLKNRYKVGVLSFDKYHENILKSNQYVLSKKRDLDECAKNLFDGLRYLDSVDIEIIVTELVPNEYIGTAINDRINRASVPISSLY